MRTNVLVIKMALAAMLCGALTPVPAFAQQLLIKDSEKIDFARALLDKSHYQLALAQFDEFIGQYPQSQSLPDAYAGAIP